MFAHEFVMVINSGLRDERFIFTGDEELFQTRDAAQVSADQMCELYALKLPVYPAD